MESGRGGGGNAVCLPRLETESFRSITERGDIDQIATLYLSAYRTKEGLKLQTNKMSKKVISLFLTLSMLCGLMVTSASATGGTWSGSGSAADPYLIADAADLTTLATNVNAGNSYASTYFKVIADITAASTWAGIGKPAITNAATNSPYVSGGTGFAGILYSEGTAKTITVDRTASVSGVGGLVNYLAPGGVVRNLNVTGTVNVTGSKDAVGGVVGYNSGTIDKVTNTATVSAGTCYNVGGVCGFNNGYYSTTGGADATGAVDGYILNSANTGAVTGYGKVGGIVGENAGTVNSCSNTAAITGTNAGKNGVGGIAGRNGNNNTAVESGRIWNCYNTANITVNSGKWAGGICGFQNSLSNCVNCYNLGNISGVSYLDHIAGNNEGSVSNCYGLRTATGPQGYDGASLKTNAEMMTTGFLASLHLGASGRWTQDVDANTGAVISLPYLTKTATTSNTNPATGMTFTMYSSPFQTTYAVGDTFDATGTIIRAVGADGSYVTVPNYTVSKTTALATSDTSVTISGSYNASSFSYTIDIKVTNPSTYYLDPNAASGGDGSQTSPFNTLTAALTAAGVGDVIALVNTVELGNLGRLDNDVTFTRANGFTGVMFNVNPGSGNTLILTTMRVNGTGTLFAVNSGTLQLRGGLVTKNAAVAVAVGANSALTLNKAAVRGTTNSVTVANGGAFTLEDFGGSVLSGPVYLADGTRITVGAAIPCDIEVESETAASGTVIANGTGSYTLTEGDYSAVTVNGGGVNIILSDNQIVIAA